jgi:hypothetical protein
VNNSECLTTLQPSALTATHVQAEEQKRFLLAHYHIAQAKVAHLVASSSADMSNRELEERCCARPL